MNRIALTLLSAIIATGAAASPAPAADTYAINWYSIDGGGGLSSGGAYDVAGTAAQPDAGPQMTGGAYTIVGGFWLAAGAATTSCTGDVNADGLVNVTDLLDLLATWGACGNPDACAADFAPAGGDGLVNVTDLLDLLAAWGPCP